ncbi:C2 calcium/lipid-binding plant phosphoribosyltransferase family protein [Perilla frutescens var. hirtella]|uniref:C2 calcium/lipid-binding plant phosphoribosyltransferase family protein n=1 Tax=Perilla frutescens var. hirtella TaxID=608512 RepID=A0AAD4IQN8_PERFH|nr:C2 calcium/lipid-binding plant phosphoribosyltransferase family protein [Perilla frutescens var. hirtella]
MSSDQPPPPSDQPKPPSTVRKLVVEVIEARDLLPKDGQGSSSPYVVADFDGQKRRTSTVPRNLNPVWNEVLEFVVSDPKTMEFEELNVEVFNDKKLSNGNARKNHFLGRVKLYGSQFVKRGEEGLVYFTLEKKSVFSWIKGELGLKIYYYDEIVEEQPPPPPEEQPPPPPQEEHHPPPHGPHPYLQLPPHGPHPHLQPEEVMKKPVFVVPEEPPPPMEPREHSPPVVRIHEPPPENAPPPDNIPPPEFSPDMRRMQMGGNGMPGPMSGERVKVLRRPANGDYSPRIIAGKFAGDTSERIQAFDLVEPMQYLFVRIVKARGLCPNENPHVRVRTSGHFVRSKPAVTPPGGDLASPEWSQVFALGYNKETAANSTLEISVWDGASEKFLGGVCFDLSDVPVRDPPDSPLAPQWYHLEGGAAADEQNRVSGDLQLSVWIGTQADDAFPESWSADAPQPLVTYMRPKVYQSPKLWYLRVTVIEAQDLHIMPNLPPLTAPEIRVKGQLGFQSVRTRRGSMSQHTSAFHWNEDLIFVAGEPLEDSLILLVEDRTGKDPVLLGHVLIPVGSVEQRVDERHVAAKWYGVEGSGAYSGRVQLRMCLEGGYHVLDEAAHLCSDFRPTAKQLWKPAVGILELGILGGRGLLPMKSKANGKGSTDSYCVAKYGKKWVRTRTVTDTFDPRWNEQYTWQVYDPCTVMTIGVFDNWRMFAEPGEERPDCRIGKVRIRVSTLESNKVYMNSYPLMVLSRTGLKKMGEIELALRFACPSLLPDTCGVYGQPLLPRMHYLRPLGVAQQEALRGAATKMVAAWLGRAEPPLGPEVVRYMLDADSNSWSMRKSKANWFRIVAVLAWAVGLAKWLDHIRRWRNPVTTILVHVLYLVLVWYPDMVVPTGFLYVFLIGVWYYRFKPKIPAGMDIKLSQADTVDPDELDEEFDTFPSSRPPEIIRVRYDRLRILAARVQTVLGDFATQGERIQALVSWRDPRATKLFIGVCLAITIILYVVPPKMVAVALGFYFLRHPMFRDPMPPASLSFFRRLPGLSDRLL